MPCAFFKPAGTPLYELEEVLLAADELEAVRLADCEELYRTEAALRMQVSRQTFDRILTRARGKIACALVNGRALRIEGTPAAEPATAELADVVLPKPASRKRPGKSNAR